MKLKRNTWEVQQYMKILVADDEADIRNLIQISLEEIGYAV